MTEHGANTPADGGIATEELQSVQYVAFKAPPFMEGSVDGWFEILDAHFHLQKITSELTKYFHTISCLPPNIVSRLAPEVLATRKFSNIREAVQSFYETSKPELFERLISTSVMTGRPSVFLQDLLAVAAKVGVGDDLVRHKFLQALPPPLNTILAVQKELTLLQLGKLADELLPITKTQCMAAPAVVSEFNRAPIAAVASEQRQSAPSGTNLGVVPFHAGQRPKICRAHLYFAEAARTCKPWCRWPNKRSSMTMQPSSRPSSRSASPDNRPTQEN